ncbi:precorrin-3B synthase [Rhizobium sp. BK251]|uniref:precorrin-3B synthase n=1 Tax=Rhizobium sp. BK251 TaxID=2512125 RepID=UPI0010461084|nr:precorrin-3B synthase [Rhizobium sp. BK251]TCL68433.1 precorrin-3B synthase [Rhizobium sp. BK251]
MTQADGRAETLHSAHAAPARVAAPPVARPRPVGRRNACPTLSAPMETGDGLLARFRPVVPGFSINQARGLAATARRSGNGIIEITARGSLQIRGLSAETVPQLTMDILATGIVPASGVAVEVPPLAGIDPLETADPRDLADRLRARIETTMQGRVIAPKLSIVVDGGGRFDLSRLTADIRLRALERTGSEWTLSIGGTEEAARTCASLSVTEAVDAVIALLQLFADKGPGTRARDVTDGDLRLLFRQYGQSNSPVLPKAEISSGAGIHDLGSAGTMLALRLAYGQVRSTELGALADAAGMCGAMEIRPAPQHSLFVLGLDAERATRLKEAAATLGFRTEANDSANHIAACAGAGACASAFYSTRSLGEAALQNAPELLDGSLMLHLSGCPKGCAHPGRSAIAFVGTPTGYGLVVNGSASAEPEAYIGRGGVNEALAGLARLVRNNKHAGESALACLTRLGTHEIAKATQG